MADFCNLQPYIQLLYFIISYVVEAVAIKMN